MTKTLRRPVLPTGSQPTMPENIDKQPYFDRAYALHHTYMFPRTLQAPVTQIYCYLIQRMEPRGTKSYQGQVIRAFTTMTRIHRDTGLHRTTVAKCVDMLHDLGLIRVNMSKETKTLVVIERIDIAPPGQSFEPDRGWDGYEDFPKLYDVEFPVPHGYKHEVLPTGRQVIAHPQATYRPPVGN